MKINNNQLKQLKYYFKKVGANNESEYLILANYYLLPKIIDLTDISADEYNKMKETCYVEDINNGKVSINSVDKKLCKKKLEEYRKLNKPNEKSVSITNNQIDLFG